MKRIGKLFAMLLTVCLLFTGLFTQAASAAGSFELTASASLEGEAAASFSQFLQDTFLRLSGKQEADGSLLNLQVRLSGMDLFRLFMQIKDNALFFSLPDLSDKCYSVSAEKVQAAFSDILDQVQDQSGNPFSIEDLQEELGNLSGPTLSNEEYEAAFRPYLDLISKFFTENMRVEENVTAELGTIGKSVEGAQVMVCEPSAEAFTDLFQALGDQMKGDEALQKIVGEWADYLRSLDSVFASYGAASGMSADEMADSLLQAFEELPDSLLEAAGNIRQNGMGGTVTFRIAIKDDALIQARIDAVGDSAASRDMSFGVETVTEDAGLTTFCVFIDNAGQAMQLLGTSKEDGNMATGTGALTLNGQKLVDLIYNWDNSKTSMLMMPYGTCVVSFQGLTLTILVSDDGNGGTNHQFRVSGLEAMMGDGFKAASLNLNTTPNGNAQAPEGEVVDISEYTPEQLIDLFGGLFSQYAELFSSMAG